jgi:hypothetical protein
MSKKQSREKRRSRERKSRVGARKRYVERNIINGTIKTKPVSQLAWHS